MLEWHDRLWLIDHGASLYLHHRPRVTKQDRDPVPQTRDHVLLPYAGSIRETDARLTTRITALRAFVRRLSPRPSRRAWRAHERGVVCGAKRYVAARAALDEAPGGPLAGVYRAPLLPYLAAIARIAAGDPTAGPIVTLDESARFRWLSSPSSTVIQPSAVHSGTSADPAAELEKLFKQMVATP